MPTRRHFLASSSAVCALAVVPKSLLAQSARAVFTNASMGAYTQGILTMANFTALVGSTFTAFLPDGGFAYLRLQSVTSLSTSQTSSNFATRAVQSHAEQPAQLLDNSFLLTFASGNQVLPQSTYLVDHGTLGSFAVFLVPGSTTPGSATAHATFSYLPQAAPISNTTSGSQLHPIYTAPAQPVSSIPQPIGNAPTKILNSPVTPFSPPDALSTSTTPSFALKPVPVITPGPLDYSRELRGNSLVQDAPN